MFHPNRLVLGALAASLLAFSFVSLARAQSTPGGVKNVVLVHGAFADGSSWGKVIPQLMAKGLNVSAVQLPLTSLNDDVAVTRRAIARMDGPVLLVGHSWAGVVITEAGNDPKVAGLLYVSALVPNDGQGAADLGKDHPPAPGGAGFREDAAGFLTLTLKGMETFFVPDASPAEQKVTYATQGPWAKSALSQKVSKAAWKTKPSWDIIDTQDQMIQPDLQRAQARMMEATTLELKSGHVPMLSQPGKVAAFILSAAQQLPAGSKAVATGR
ncbi:MAG: alpha/beta hydrolase [Cytophagales bacterium]|nr:alpha/beta hydrolase [Cytophagales bacterium]